MLKASCRRCYAAPCECHVLDRSAAAARRAQVYRQRLAAGETQADIARSEGITRQTVNQTLRRRPSTLAERLEAALRERDEAQAQLATSRRARLALAAMETCIKQDGDGFLGAFCAGLLQAVDEAMEQALVGPSQVSEQPEGGATT